MPVHEARNRLAGRVEGGRGRTREGRPVLRRRAVLPLSTVDRERQHPRGRRVGRDGGKEPGPRQTGREGSVPGVADVPCQRVQRASVLVEEVQLTIPVFAEGDDTDRRPRDLRHLPDAVPLDPRGPQSSRLPIAEEIGADQLREPRPVIDQAAGDAAGDRVRQLDQRRVDRRWPDRPGLDGLRALHHRPAVVPASLDSMDGFPKLPAHVPDVQLAGQPIEAHPPGVAEAVCPDFRPGSLHRDEGVVAGNGVILARVLMAHIDPQDGGEQVGDVLARVERVGRVWVTGVTR